MDDVFVTGDGPDIIAHLEDEIRQTGRELAVLVGVNFVMQPEASEQALLDMMSAEIAQREPIDAVVVEEIKDLLLLGFRTAIHCKLSGEEE
jgi:hypothetical protein